jgi:hypothetical protein
VAGERLRQGAWAGIIAAAATLGALVGFGRARGASLAPINAVAHTLLGTRAYVVTHFDPLVTPAAIAVHVGALLLWAIIFSAVAGRLRGLRLVGAAVGYAGIVYLVDHFVLPDRFVPGFARALSAPEIGVVYLVLAFALVVGTRAGADHARCA